MAEEKLQLLEIVTPERKVYSQEVRFVVVPGSEGELGFLPEHAALVSAVKVGLVRVHHEGKILKIAVSGGFVEVRSSRVTILANSAEREDQIDVKRAEEAKERAEHRLQGGGDIDTLRAEAALKRALNRLKAVS
ncbi:ATP synthase F1 subcomplex epsilon subunit [Desulfotomaculum arcticum]|uniref:ATP synthase epsilon chain n=1 Tax=Desulfotruncus arcticus DSM 17038 TaxID=1121424 RepID=A0A1I2WYK3_9FIRM|nr:F0F1 ATP synthase subunit epsilon [Desulfotruncus arcticus]SFH06388.1 ATP synthase F1 subcomplex epsilon subunit [Desulfotomaculum arcticum] [Desulfotruncus arcticus DSM 17038]